MAHDRDPSNLVIISQFPASENSRTSGLTGRSLKAETRDGIVYRSFAFRPVSQKFQILAQKVLRQSLLQSSLNAANFPCVHGAERLALRLARA
jgi:hypothetical protein